MNATALRATLLVLGLTGAICIPSSVSAQWILSPGEGWVDLTLIRHDTRSRFDLTGDRNPLANEGHAVTTSLFVTAAVGLLRGVDAWVQAPVHSFRFDDAAGPRTRSGLGEPRLFVRVGPQFVGLPAVPIALRGGVKWPSGRFEADAEIIPLGEGQRDFELLLEAGRSFHPRPVYVMGWGGYRWRGPNHRSERDPGDERFWYLAAGGSTDRFGWKAAAEGLDGDPWRIHGLRIPSTPREMTQLLLSVDTPISRGRAGLGVRVPLAGRNLPAGNALTIQYFFRFGGHGS